MAIVNLQAILSADHPELDVDAVIQLLETNNWDESVSAYYRNLKTLGRSFSFLCLDSRCSRETQSPIEEAADCPGVRAIRRRAGPGETTHAIYTR